MYLCYEVLCNIISDPQFIPYFTHHRHKEVFLDCDSFISQPDTILIHKTSKEMKGGRLNHICFKNYKIPHGELLGPAYLKFLLSWPVKIKASINDLLLVSEPSGTALYLCNPLTRKWLALSNLPQANKYDKYALGCELDICDKKLKCTNNISYRFKVVLFDLYKQRELSKDYYQFDVAIFSSEMGMWSNCAVSTWQRLRWACSSAVVACNGMLHWIEGQGLIPDRLIVFYPFAFSDAKRFLFLGLPSDLGWSWRSYIGNICLGVCQGLRMLRLFKFTNSFHLKI